MASRIKSINFLLGIMIVTGAVGASLEALDIWKASALNGELRAGKIINDKVYPLHEKFSAAYFQGQHRDFKHAVQTYNQIVESRDFQQSVKKELQSSVQFNIGNNLFVSGLVHGFDDNGVIKEEGKYNFLQAKIAYEQALRLNPDSRKAKFNLSLLHTVIPLANQTTPKDQSAVELSNLPIGLP